MDEEAIEKDYAYKEYIYDKKGKVTGDTIRYRDDNDDDGYCIIFIKLYNNHHLQIRNILNN